MQRDRFRNLRIVVCAVLVTAGLSIASRPAAAQSVAARESARASVEHLARVMDQFHDRFPVYDDVSSAGNHFHAWAKIPDQHAAVSINGSWTVNPRSGATAIRCEFTNVIGQSFAGFYFLNGVLPPNARAPELNFGTVANAGIDLSGATALTFWARGELGGEKIDFFVAGVGRNADNGQTTAPFPDSSARYPPLTASGAPVGGPKVLGTSWQKFTLDLTGRDLSYVLGGFGWVARAVDNPFGATFYLDDIQFELSPDRRALRLDEPRFLVSFTTLPLQPDLSDGDRLDDLDLVLRNTAFTYDNALAILAFLADGTADGLRRARLVGDAFVYASDHDRTFRDGRLRTAYAGGDIALPPGWIPNDRIGTVPVAGFFTEVGQTFFEVEQGAVDVGNNAWAMIALLALHRRTGAQEYLEAARKLAAFVRTFRNDVGLFRGFQGGLQDPESPEPTRRPWASVEHNLDVHAGFKTLALLTGDGRWLDDSDHARGFVDAMWDTGKQCYLAGTIDPNTRNALAGQLPLDVQAWSVLARPDDVARHADALDCAERSHRTADHGFVGFDFNEDRDGIWFEGTAHMTVADARAGRAAAAEALRQELRRVQQTPPFGDGGGIAAASHDGLSTGFDFFFSRRLHVGATAWNVFAQLEFNPFYDFERPTPLEQFVARFYTLVLGRAPDPAGLRGWTEFLRGNCNADGLAALAEGFFDSVEFRTNKAYSLESLVTLFYDTFLGRPPDPAGLAGWIGFVRHARLAIAQGFIASAEFQGVLPSRSDRAAVTTLVGRLYREILGREPDAAGLASAVDYIVTTGDLEGTAVGFLSSVEFERRVLTARGYVSILYRAFLGREPDPSGWDAGERAVRNIVLQVIDAGFVPSPEFQGLLPGLCGS